jgi:hypothetical protein
MSTSRWNRQPYTYLLFLRRYPSVVLISFSIYPTIHPGVCVPLGLRQPVIRKATLGTSLTWFLIHVVLEMPTDAIFRISRDYSISLSSASLRSDEGLVCTRSHISSVTK